MQRVRDGHVRAEVLNENLGEEIDAYVREGCRGSWTLARSAILAYRYELASEGLEEHREVGGEDDHGDDPGESHDSVADSLRSLERIEQSLEPAQADPGEQSKPVEVAVPEEFREQMPKARGFKMGELQIVFEQLDGPPYGHLSVSYPSRYPSFEELLRARTAPGGSAPNLWAWLPAPDRIENMKPNTVHLYILPPKELLGS